jgi:sugar phosphate isomerase/epimerase
VTAAAVFAAGDVRMALEFAAYGSVATLPQAIALCGALGWERCGLLLDSWHVLRGEDPWPALESLDGSQIALVHLNDAAHLSSLDPVHDSRFRREPPGGGTLDLARFLDVLSAIGYRGEISLEVLSSRLAATPPAATARELMASIVTAGLVQPEPPDPPLDAA